MSETVKGTTKYSLLFVIRYTLYIYMSETVKGTTKLQFDICNML